MTLRLLGVNGDDPVGSAGDRPRVGQPGGLARSSSHRTTRAQRSSCPARARASARSPGHRDGVRVTDSLSTGLLPRGLQVLHGAGQVSVTERGQTQRSQTAYVPACSRSLDVLAPAARCGRPGLGTPRGHPGQPQAGPECPGCNPPGPDRRPRSSSAPPRWRRHRRSSTVRSTIEYPRRWPTRTTGSAGKQASAQPSTPPRGAGWLPRIAPPTTGSGPGRRCPAVPERGPTVPSIASARDRYSRRARWDSPDRMTHSAISASPVRLRGLGYLG